MCDQLLCSTSRVIEHHHHERLPLLLLLPLASCLSLSPSHDARENACIPREAGGWSEDEARDKGREEAADLSIHVHQRRTECLRQTVSLQISG